MTAPATVSDFRLDTYEVTVGRFRAFVNAGKGTTATAPAANAGAHPKIVGSGWDTTWNSSLATNTAALVSDVIVCRDSGLHTYYGSPTIDTEVRPINCITWFEALAFCIWDGGFLPTEAEWNYAASGGEQQRAYPWSDPPGTLTLDSAHASYSPDNGTNCVGDGMPGCDVTDFVAVGTKPAGDGRWGQSDLAGNVIEWTLDWFADTYPLPCTDCANLVQPSQASRVLRGGAFDQGARGAAGSRSYDGPMDHNYHIGVRCARTP
jgi:formylglycine-generating enzyme required for sulfatase activity